MSASLDLFPLRPSSNHYPDLPDHLALSSFLAHSSNPHSPAPASSYARKVATTPSGRYLPFVPLTPIMASPLLTPDLPHAPSPAAVLDTPPHLPVSAHDPPLPQHHQQADYISHHANPTWTTSPPTPPSKQPSPSPPSPLRALGGRTSSSPRSSLPGSVTSSTASTNRSGPRPASIASYAPTPLSCSYSPDLSSESRTTSAPTARASALPTRRLSLPSDFFKPLPPRPQSVKELPPLPMHPQSAAVHRPADAETLLPSLSRHPGHAHALASRTDGASARAGADNTLRAHARRLFSLADDDDDDADGDLSDSEDRVQKRGARERTDSGQESAAAEATARDREQEKERAERVRRYHALMELLTTEVGYLLDLRVLVTVYLDQLLLLSAASPSAMAPVPVGPSALPTPPSGRSMSSGLSALFPSSRSSFFHHSPAPSPSPSTADFLAGSINVVDADDDGPHDRTRQSSGTSTSTDGTSRERERDNENLARIPPYSGRQGKSARAPPPILTEKDVRAVCRNAQDLLRFHERFVGELHAAVGLVGYGMVLDARGNEGWLEDMRGDGETVVSDLVEHAVEVVATKFVNEAASFSIYETFCPGHAAATDLVRRAQERWPALWEAYEQRCTLLVAHDPDGTALHDRGRSDDTPSAPSPVIASEDGTGAGSLRQKTRRHSTPALAFAAQHARSAPAQPTPSSTLDGAALGHAGALPFPSAWSPLSAALPRLAAFPHEGRARGAGAKLKFMDHLIKPVQRICKYPLLLDQLRPRRRDAAADDTVDAVVRAAGAAMRDVVARVNSASEKEAHNLRSALIASRITYTCSPAQAQGQISLPSAVASAGVGAGTASLSSAPSAYPPSAASSSSSSSSSSHGHAGSVTSSAASSCASTPATTAPSSATASPGPAAVSSLPPLTTATASAQAPRPTGLTAEFVSSLGPCVLAGALDVLQPPANRAKYLGAFLYAGGYCILVKIAKGGRAYEPKHWFPLGEAVDAEEDDPLFPYSFHVSTHGGHLRLAASCPQEKAVWLGAINDALSTKPAWVNEPLPSFQADDKSPLSPADEPPQESPSGLPTIQSLSELETQSDGADAVATTPTSATPPVSAAPSAAAGGKGQLRYSRTLSRLDGFSLRQEPSAHPPLSTTFSAALSRRSSTASVKAFFAPISFDSARVARPSAQVRAQVEHALHDLFSEACVAARSQAQMRGEELFQLRSPAGGGGSSSGGGSGGGAGGGGGGGGALGKRSSSGLPLPLPRSNSGISIANAMGFTAAKRRYDSVLVSRRKSSLDEVVPDFMHAPGENTSAAGAETSVCMGANASVSGGISASASASVISSSSGLLAGRGTSLAARRQKSRPASIAPAITTAIAQQTRAAAARRDGSGSEALSLDSPPAVSRCSSVSSHPGLDSLLPSPSDASPLPMPMPMPTPGASPSGTLRPSDIPQPGADADAQQKPKPKPKRARSMVSTVRGFFNPPPPSLPPREDVPSMSDPGRRVADAPFLGESPTSEVYPSGIVQWLRRTSIRRRDSGSSGSRSTDGHHSQQHQQHQQHQQQLHVSRRPVPTRSSTDGISGHGHDRSSSGSAASFCIPQSQSPGRGLAVGAAAASEGSAPKRRRSLFVPSSRVRGGGPAAARDGEDDSRCEDVPSAHVGMPSRRSIKTLFRFHRSNSFTPAG